AEKARIFGAHTVQVLNRDDPWVAAMRRASARVIGFGDGAPTAGDYGLAERDGSIRLMRGAQPLLALDDMKLAGRHNAHNALAALALCEAVG
ncbi:UNVERIFIED_CONTAM: UDP-N-acetylmuramoyl-L-alanine--D-glutamate ligase, partial [Salmonella enterica subsp. enterica serovar Weltevreden]